MGVWSAIDEQAQELGPAVVPNAIHHAFAFGDERKVEVGQHHPLPLREGRREQVPFGGDDGGVATAAERFVELGLPGDELHLFFRQEAGRVDDEAP